MRTAVLLIATTMLVVCACSPAWGRTWVITEMANAGSDGPDNLAHTPRDLCVDGAGYARCWQRTEDFWRYEDESVSRTNEAVHFWWQDASGWHSTVAGEVYGWYNTIDETDNNFSLDYALALKADGTPQLAGFKAYWNYWDWDAWSGLMSGTSPPPVNGWTYSSISSDVPYRSPTLALDADDRRHVACVSDDSAEAQNDYTEELVYYASPDGTNWAREVVREQTTYGQIVVAGTRQPGILFVPWYVGLGFALRGAAGWTQESVLSSDPPAWEGAMDVAGVVHLAYAHPTGKALYYAWRDSAGWHYQAVPGAGSVEHGLSLALGRDSQPAVAYVDAAMELRYAWRDSSGWHNEVVGAGWAMDPSLAVDRTGTAHIVYYRVLGWGYARAHFGAPSAPALTIRPASPSPGDGVTATATGSVDPEGDALQYCFGWALRVGNQWVQKRGRTTLSPSDTLPASLTENSQRWKCYVQATDGRFRSAVVEKEFRIGQPPSRPTLTLAPSEPRDADNVKVTISGSTDPDGDPITYWINWSVAVGGQWVQKRGRITTRTYDVLPASLTAAGQAWKCAVIATDEPDTSVQPDRSRVVEQRFSILADGAPTTPTLTISPPAPGPSSDVKATVSGCVDPEGDPLSYTYGWSVKTGEQWVLKRGRSTSRTYDVLPATLTEAGQQWACRVIASDGQHRTRTVEKRFTISSTGTAGVAAAMVTSLSAVSTARGAQIVFTLSAPAEVQAEVLNIAGRPVRLITRGTPLEAGTQTMVWTGQSDAGLAVPNGTYLVRVTARSQDGASSQALGTVVIRR